MFHISRDGKEYCNSLIIICQWCTHRKPRTQNTSSCGVTFVHNWPKRSIKASKGSWPSVSQCFALPGKTNSKYKNTRKEGVGIIGGRGVVGVWSPLLAC